MSTPQKQTVVQDVWKNNQVKRKEPERDEYFIWYEKNKALFEKKAQLINLENPLDAPAEPILQMGDFTLFRCAETGFMYFNPRLTEEATRDFFSQPFLDEYYKEVDESFEKRKEIAYKDICSKIASFLQKGDRILEVGCGTGPKLRILRDDYGLTVRGIEISPLAEKYHQKHYLDVEIGSIETASFPSSSFDMVFMWSVADHFENPIAAFKKCYDLTKPGGYFLIAGINTEGFDHATTGLDNVAYRPPSRMNLYGVRSLKAHLQKAGYSILENYTPGKLDVAMVKDYWNTGGHNGRNTFLENLILNGTEDQISHFQSFLSENGLSGFQVMVAQKK